MTRADRALSAVLVCAAVAACGENRDVRTQLGGVGPRRGVPTSSPVITIDRAPPDATAQAQGYALGADAAGNVILSLLPAATARPYTEYWGSIFLLTCVDPIGSGLEENVTFRVTCDGTTRIDLDVLTATLAAPASLTVPGAGGVVFFDLYIDDFAPAVGDVSLLVDGQTMYPTRYPFGVIAR